MTSMPSRSMPRPLWPDVSPRAGKNGPVSSEETGLIIRGSWRLQPTYALPDQPVSGWPHGGIPIRTS